MQDNQAHSDAGAMADAVAAFGWNATPLGAIASWPQSLRTTVDLILAAPIPMFIAWGSARTFLYNDAYVPILGQRHPAGLGMPMAQLWSDVWGQFGPIVDMAAAGRSTFATDMPAMLERDGVLQQAFFTFSYSPVRAEGGVIGGVLCVVQETTATVLAERARLGETERLRQLFAQAPGFIAILRGPQHVYEMVNSAYLRTVGQRALIGRAAREAVPELDGQGFFELLDQVRATGQPYLARGTLLRIERSTPGVREDVYVNFIYQPIFAADGSVDGIFVEGSDVTDQHLAERGLARHVSQLEKVERRLAFQLALSDRLALFADPADIIAVSTQMLGVALEADRVLYLAMADDENAFTVAGEWCAAGVGSVGAGPRSLSQFGVAAADLLRAGGVFVADDVSLDARSAGQLASYAAIGVQSHLTVPLLKSGKLVAMLTVHSALAGNWSADRIDKTRYTADRMWSALHNAHIHHALQAERDQSRHILENMLEGLILLDSQRRVVQVNREAARIAGIDADAAAGLPLPRLWSAAPGHALAQLFEQVSNAGAPARCEIEDVRPGGALWIDARCHPWIDGGLALFLRDISESKQAEQALRDSEAKFRTIADTMPQMLFSSLPDGYHDYFNQQWYDYTGMAGDSTDGTGWLALFHPDDQARTTATWQHSLNTGAPYEMEYRVRHQSGQYRWALARALPIRDQDGVLVRWMGSITDIHDHRLNQEALRAADQRKDEFLAMLAHELRNPLAPISAGAELLRMAKIDETRVRQTSALISRQVKHMTSLIDDLMDVSRVTRGLVMLERAVIDVRTVVADAVEQVRPLIDARQHRLAVHTTPGPAWVMGDQKRLIQAVSNVLNNAAKYTPQGGSVELHMDAGGGQVRIAVTDNGIGLAPGMAERVFELFTQAERTPDRAQGGLGIGLALVKSLVELHEGSVMAHSEGAGQGSVFTITLPCVAPPPAPLAPVDAAGLDQGAGSGLRILIVDDNQDAALMLGMFLESAGHRVTIEHDATRALAQARAAPPDVCLLDIGLPDMDGNTLARHLRAEPSTAGILLVAVTGYGQEQDRRDSAAAGFDHHFVKPVDARRLLELLALARG